MSRLNKIYYGSAGTGKTREAIIQALGIINQSEKIDFEFDVNDDNAIFKSLKLYSNPRILNLSPALLKQQNIIKDLNNKDVDILFDNPNYESHFKKAGITKEKVLDYKLHPLIEMVTFHPSYSYQDFVEGITVDTNDKNEIKYNVKDGIFKKICNRAIANTDYEYVLIIDEINRGDISSIFGELFTLLEDNKREELQINLPYSKDSMGNPEKLFIPKNLHIVATMNTVDKSIALIDVALRRRFEFIEMKPDYDTLSLDVDGINLQEMLKAINERITILKNEHYQIGHSYFMEEKIKNFNDLKNVMTKDIIPLLQEYFYDDWRSICAVLNQSYEKPKSGKGLFDIKEVDEKMFASEFKELREFNNKKIVTIRNFAEDDISDDIKDTIKKIYE